MPAHIRSNWAVPTFFLIAALGQFALGLELRPKKVTRGVLVTAIAANLIIVFVWITSRSVGVPFFDGLGVEPVGLADVVATGQEVVAVGAAGYLIPQSRTTSAAGRELPTERGAVILVLTSGLTLGAMYVALLHP